MENCIILFQNNDEYGHWDIIGVFSSYELMIESWKTLLENRKKRDGGNYYGPLQEMPMNWSEELTKAEKRWGKPTSLGGDGFYWEVIKVNAPLWKMI